jgi:hypothetical protein
MRFPRVFLDLRLGFFKIQHVCNSQSFLGVSRFDNVRGVSAIFELISFFFSLLFAMDGRGRSAPTCIGNIQELMAQGNIRVEVHRYRSLMFNENVSWRRLLIGQQKLCQILYKGRYIKKVAMRFNNNLAIKTHSSFLSE